MLVHRQKGPESWASWHTHDSWVFSFQTSLWSYSYSSLFLKYFQAIVSPHHTAVTTCCRQQERWLCPTGGDRGLYHGATGWEHPGRGWVPAHSMAGHPQASPMGASLRQVNLWLEVSDSIWGRDCALCLYSLWVCEGCICLTVWRTYELISLYPAACVISVQIFFRIH